MKILFSIFITLGISTLSLHAQKRVIKSRVIDEFFEISPYVLIMVEDTVNVGKTDIHGYYKVEIPVFAKKVSFISVGMELTDIILKEQCDEVEVVMMASVTYDFITLKKVDRLRMRRFKKLPEIHKEAVRKGLFKKDTLCYIQQFTPMIVKKVND